MPTLNPQKLFGKMSVGKHGFLLALISTAYCYPSSSLKDKCVSKSFKLVTREEWGAREPVSVSQLNHPVSYVVIHHSHEPGACYSREDCNQAMRSMQNYHQLTQGWTDIGYNFAVGGDGAAYVGRGWNAVGAHAIGYNFNSIGIVLIGSWITELPPGNELETVKQLISTGVELGYISPDYTLIGHRQVTATECPGEALYQEISTWDRFSAIL